MARLLALLLLPFSLLSVAHANDLESPYIGVEVVAIADAKDSIKAENIRLPTKAGVLVTRIDPKSPASKSGLKVGEIITQVNKQRTASEMQFKAAVEKLEIGKEAAFNGFGLGGSGWKSGNVRMTPFKYGEYLESQSGKSQDDFSGEVSLTSPFRQESRAPTHFRTALSNATKDGSFKLLFRIIMADTTDFPASASFKTDVGVFELKSLGKRTNIGGLDDLYEPEKGKELDELMDAIYKSKSVTWRLINSDGGFQEFTAKEEHIRDLVFIMDLKRWLEKK